MQLKDLVPIVSAAAPLLGSALGGPLGGIAGTLIASVFGGSKDDPADLLARIQAVPDHDLKLLQLQNEHEEALLHIETNDTANARNREIELAKAGDIDKTPEVLTIMIVISLLFVYTIAVMIKEDAQDYDITKSMLDILKMGLGAAIAYVYGMRKMNK
jgi:hypothetical protein